MSDEQQIKYHTRHEMMARTGKRISRGAWERLNRAYNVYHVKTQRVLVGFNEKGDHVYEIRKSFTCVIHPETTKAHRKLGIRERYRPELTKRARYDPQKAVGIKS